MGMTLFETERVIRKLSELLHQRGNSEISSKLAEDFADACHAANLRLQQCEAMIKANDRHQVIQLAETSPNLLDLITVLEFRSADDWRAFCQQNALPVAERIDARSVRALNDCYAQGITTDHPLYAAYRKAVLNRNDEEALKALQSIARLNPTDGNAASELARLDAKVLVARLEHLGGMLNGSEAALIVAAIETIEAFGFKTQPKGEAWCKAAIIRCGFLLEQADQLKAASEWMDALTKLDFIRLLKTELKLELSATDIKRLDALESWARAEQEKDRKNCEFGALLAELHYRVRQSEEKDTSARYVKLPELRDDFEALHKVWRSLTDFTRPIPEDAAAAFRKRSALLEAEIARRTAIRRRTVLVSSAAALVVGGVIVWFVVGQMRAREFADQLDTAIAQRQARATEHLLERIRSGKKRLLNVGSVNAAVASAETFVTKERELLANFEAAFAKLPTRLGGNPDVARVNSIANQLTVTRTALNALAPDLKTECEPRIAAFERQWQQFLSEDGAVVNGLLEQWIGRAEKQCTQFDYRAPVEKAATQIATLSGVMQKINDCEAGFTNHLSLRSDLLQRAGVVRAKSTTYDRELKKLDEGMTTLTNARAFADYSAAISLIASSEFSGAPAVTAATSIQTLGVSDEAALRSLLGATNAATWAFIKKRKPENLVPEISMPAELASLQRLNTDPAVSASHQQYRLWLDRKNTRSVDWITAGSFDSAQGWKQIKAWTPFATATSATFEDREYGYFDGQWKLSPTQPIYRLENVSDLRETCAFDAIGLGQVWTSGSTYSGPMLKVLDAVKNSRDGSPVFRAYLFCSLVELMEFQPDAWGLSFCPSARAHAAQIRAIVGGQIASGDWFVPSKAKGWSEKLDQFLTTEESLSYAKQAAGNLSLARSVAKDGLRYVGFVGLDGKPVITEDPPPAEMWGYEGVRKQPALISGSAMPLSPLFALPVSRMEYLTKAGIREDAPIFANGLPPLFRAATKP
jgi:hypothetical protein